MATHIRFDGRPGSREGELVQGEGFRFDSTRFESHLMAPMGPLPAGLMRIAVGVYVADRKRRRRNGSPWSASMRYMGLRIQVSRPDFWDDAHVRSLVEDLLRFLSPDLWSLEFERLPFDPNPQQTALPLVEEIPVVCLYSGGLDSASGLATWLRDHSQPMLAVTVLHQSDLKRRCGHHIRLLREHYRRNVNLVPVRVHLVDAGRIDAQERSQRCRAFLFLAAAIVTAISRGADKILMFESGVGAVNVPMMAGMATGGRTTRGSHPHVLVHMSELASLIARRPIHIELPYWQSTKAELVRNLAVDTASGNLKGLARDTVSCVHHPRRTLHRQCGVCPACIGRRQAMLCTGIDEDPAEYEHDIFARDEVSVPPPEKLKYLKAMIAQVHDFGAIGEDLALPVFLRRWFLGTGITDSEDGARPWLDALRRYRAEWLRLAETHRNSTVPWPTWLLPCDQEQQPYASGF